MFLKHIHLKNFRGIQNFSLSFQEDDDVRKWTMILGENGTGKTNILRAIALVCAGSNALGELLGSLEGWIQNDKPYCLIEAILQNEDGEEREISLKIARGDNLSTVMQQNNKSLELLDNALKYASRNYFLLGYGAYRKLEDGRSHRKSRFFENARARRVATLFNRDASLNHLEDWVIDLDYRLGEEGLKIVQKAINEFLPNVRFSHIDKKQKQLLFETHNGLVPFELLSDGYQNMAGWLGDLLYHITSTFEDYKDPLKTRGLLLIDELELHLHPNWQRRLINYINKIIPNIQIITTTHSPLTAQQAPENALWILRKAEDKKIECTPFVGDPQKLDIEQFLTTPAFGLSTTESLEVEQKKAEYERLKAKKNKSAEDQSQLEEVTSYLEEIPDRSLETEADKRRLELMKKIEKHLSQQR